MTTKEFKVNLVSFPEGEGDFYSVTPIASTHDCNRCWESALSLPQHDMRLVLFYSEGPVEGYSAEIMCPKCGDGYLEAQAKMRGSDA